MGGSTIDKTRLRRLGKPLGSTFLGVCKLQGHGSIIEDSLTQFQLSWSCYSASTGISKVSITWFEENFLPREAASLLFLSWREH